MTAAHRRTKLRIATLLAAVMASMLPVAGARAATNQYGDMVDYPLVFPVDGTVHYSDTFYASRADGQHHAQDLMAAKMVPVLAVAAATVTSVNYSSTAAGISRSRCCTLALRHDDGWKTTYIHLNNDTPGTDDGLGWGIADGIVPGAHVTAGQLIGWVGDSGNAEGTAPHLHFELRDPAGVLVNPYQALRTAQGQPRPACTGAGTSPLAAFLGGTTPLRRGSTGSAVYELQGFLKLQGYAVGTVDGVYGSATVAAVRSFQQRQGMAVDGVAGTGTRAAVRTISQTAGFASLADPAGKILRPGDRGPEVKELQRWLKAAGYDPGSIDGFYGPRTEAKVRSLQQAASGVAVDGKVGAGTRAALAKALRIVSPGNCG
jgi:peptidoglycan hydrolase-like protein with peptidoglycan-binding domain